MRGWVGGWASGGGARTRSAAPVDYRPPPPPHTHTHTPPALPHATRSQPGGRIPAYFTAGGMALFAMLMGAVGKLWGWPTTAIMRNIYKVPARVLPAPE